MNSYPPELLTQLAPVMFVGGLEVPSSGPTPSTPDTAVPIPQKQQQDPFHILTVRLREALLSQRKVAIWQPEKNKSFQVILVDRDVRFPPRKLISPDDPQYTIAHSPLSPLTPASPLHPDGLIAPIWVRKHTTLIPSVFVLFLRIFEHPLPSSRNPLDVQDADQKEREAEERKRDTELSADIAQRKKVTSERGIKLTVVLIASRRMLDDPTLDARLTYIRKQSGLDSRAALFVLSPVSPSELNEFVRSLQQALYEPALEYYTSHSKRVRRKRNRHSQATSAYPNPGVGGLNIARPLRPEGWTVRYEYKMACFAEFRSEDDVALKHYQDAYEMLIIMFGSTAMLPPRTKRWAEAKVLADCINIKIIKLYLYNNEHSLALSHHNTHIRQFGDFSRGWGIGEETFEFWSWIARQHRVLAELLEQGTKSTLVLPVHKPAVPPSNAAQQQTTGRPVSGLEYESMRSLGINPSHALQHPGFYYYLAARCTELRRKRFNAALEAELSQKPITLSPGFTNEKKVEHLAIINELYTKAYELFKKHSAPSSQGQGRLTLWIAYQIGQTYYAARNFELAIRFLERIAKTYRRECWHAMMRPLLSTWYSCAQQLGNVELSVKLLLEMLGHGMADEEDPSSLEEDLIAVFKSTVPSSPDQALVVDLSEAQPIFDSDVVFWSPEVKVDEQAAFQLTLTAPTAVTIGSIPFSQMRIHFSEDVVPPVVVEHQASEEEASIRRVDLGVVSAADIEGVKTNLRWQPGQTIVFTGSLASSQPRTLKISKVVIVIQENAWNVEIPFEPHSTRPNAKSHSRWLSSLNPPRFIPIKREKYHSTLVKHRDHLLHIAFHHHSPAYLDEDYPVEIEVTNTDVRDLDVVINFLLQPTEIDDAVNWIVVDAEKSTSLIKGIRLGTLSPGSSAKKTLHLFNTGAGGDRSIDVSVLSRTIEHKVESEESESEDEEKETEGESTSEAEAEAKGPEEGEDADADSDHDTMEHLKLLVVPTVLPMQAKHLIAFRRNLDPWPALADLTTFDDSFWDGRRGGDALVSHVMTCTGPWGLVIESFTLERKDNAHAKVVHASTDVNDEGMFSSEFIEGDEFCGICRISFCLDEDQDVTQNPIEGAGQYVVTWHRVLPNGERGPTATSYFGLPVLRPPLDDLVALVSVPPKAKLHTPISLTLTVRNYHASRSANVVVQLETESLEGFVVAGIRSGRLPVLLPGSEEKLVWQLIPLECGYVKVPRIRVRDRRKAVGGGAGGSDAGELVKTVDVQQDMRWWDSERGILEEEVEGTGTILVIP